MANVSGTSKSQLQQAASAYRKLAAEAPSEIKADLTLLADSEDKVAAGDALSVDNDAAQSAADHVDSVANRACSSGN